MRCCSFSPITGALVDNSLMPTQFLGSADLTPASAKVFKAEVANSISPASSACMAILRKVATIAG